MAHIAFSRDLMLYQKDETSNKSKPIRKCLTEIYSNTNAKQIYLDANIIFKSKKDSYRKGS